MLYSLYDANTYILILYVHRINFDYFHPLVPHIVIEHMDIDLCNEKDKENIRKDILSRGGDLSYPTIIVDDKILITGLHKDKINEVLEI